MKTCNNCQHVMVPLMVPVDSKLLRCGCGYAFFLKKGDRIPVSVHEHSFVVFDSEKSDVNYCTRCGRLDIDALN